MKFYISSMHDEVQVCLLLNSAIAGSEQEPDLTSCIHYFHPSADEVTNILIVWSTKISIRMVRRAIMLPGGV